MVLIELINYVGNSLNIDLVSIKFDVYYDTIFLMFILLIDIYLNRETDLIRINEDNDLFKTL